MGVYKGYRRPNYTKVALLLCALLMIFAAVSWMVYTNIPPVTAAQNSISVPTQAVNKNLSWPQSGQSTVALKGGGVLARTEDQTAVPIASVAKVMTALMLVKKYPMNPGSEGKKFTVTRKDVQSYYSYASKDGSVVPVIVGEELTEYQVLQAMLLPSANNLADSAAIWAYGSMEGYHLAANKYAREIGMKSSVFAGDASGFSSDSVSTADDLVKLGQEAIKQPVIAKIVAQKSAILPVVGKVTNVNNLVGQNGVVGIKTGNTLEAGGCFVYAVTKKIGDKPITLISAVTKAPNLDKALESSRVLIDNAFDNISEATIAKQGTLLGTYQSAWGANIHASASKDVSVLRWGSESPKISYNLPPLDTHDPAYTGSVTVSSKLETKTVPVTLGGELTDPPFSWRLLHLF